MISKTMSRRAGGRVLGAMLFAASLGLATLAGPMSAGAQTVPPYGLLINDIGPTTPRAEIAARFEHARQANASWVRADFFWYTAEWTQGTWNWSYIDALVDEADARGLRIIATLCGTPLWAATDGISQFGVPNMAAWENFVSRAAARYRGRVDIWQIWNEPDKPYSWRGTPGKYAELLARAYTKIRAVDSAPIALGGLPQGGTVLVADFLQRILGDPVYPAGRYYDLHSVHTNFRTLSGITAQINNNIAILADFGLHKPVIVTESSYTSDPVYQTVTGYVGGGEDTQARYVLDAYHVMLSHGIGVVIWATGQDYLRATGPYAATGLARADRTPKKAYDAYRNMAWGTTTSTPPPPPPPPPIAISGVSTEVTGTGSATVRWTTNVPGTSLVQYGTTATSLTSVRADGALVTSHALGVTGLTAGTTYYVKVSSKAADGTSATSGVLSFRTADAAPPPPPPIAISVVSTEVTGTGSATVRWTTNVPGTSVASYGTAATSLTSVRSDGTLVTSHALGVTGLTAGTTYYVKVSSRAADGTSATSGVLSFRTADPAPAPAVVISSLVVDTLKRGATVRWTTNVPAGSVAEWGTSSTSLTSVVKDSNLVTSHSLRLPANLKSRTTYYVRVTSAAADGRSAQSGVLSFTTR